MHFVFFFCYYRIRQIRELIRTRKIREKIKLKQKARKKPKRKDWKSRQNQVSKAKIGEKTPYFLHTKNQTTCRTKVLENVCLWNLKRTIRFHRRDTKGQLISKGLFGFLNSLKKQTKNFCPSRLGQNLTFSSSLFGRIEDTKISFRD